MRYKVKLRRGEGWEVKPEAEKLDGQILEFSEGWTIEEGDSSIYVGEKAMTIDNWHTLFADKTPLWIASGDLEEITEDL